MQTLPPSIIQQKIKKWKEALSDLSKRNRLLFFNKEKLSTVEILTPAPEVYDDLAIARKALPVYVGSAQGNKALPADLLMTAHEPPVLLKHLKKLRQVANSTLEEKGINSLFLAVGTLHWNICTGNTKDEYTSPILLLPVTLRKEPKKEEYILYPLGEDAFLNPMLVQKLRDDLGVHLPIAEAVHEATCNQVLAKVREEVAGHAEWRVEATTYISLFSYAKAVMINDLTEYGDLIAEHPVLQALAGNLSAYDKFPAETLLASELDSRVDPQRIFQVLEADSSQQEVIEAAKSGLSFVVQGPPGTGKSQTIANIVCELIGMGKKVLLVSEKQTAVQVVYDRLKQCGLAHACINLHHQGETDKKAFIAQLVAASGHYEEFPSPENVAPFYGQLRSKSYALNDHAQRVHAKKDPIGKSAFDLYGELLKRADVPSPEFALSNIKVWEVERLAMARELLLKLAPHLAFFKEEQSTIWAASSLKTYSFDERMQILVAFDALAGAVESLLRAGAPVAEVLEVDPARTLEQISAIATTASWVVSAPELPPGWPVGANPAALRSTLRALETEVSAVEALATRHAAKYDAGLLAEPDLEGLLARFREYKGLFRLFKGAYWNDRKLILSHRRSPKASDGELLEELSTAIELRTRSKRLKSASHPARTAFGTLFSDEQPNFAAIALALDWLSRASSYPLFTATVAKALQPGFKEELCTGLSRLKIALEATEKGLHYLGGYFLPVVVSPGAKSLAAVPFDEVTAFLAKARQELDIFQDWLEYTEALQELEALGLSPFLATTKAADLEPQQWFPALEKGVLRLWLECIHTEEPNLRKFNQQAHEQTLQEFTRLDAQQLQVACERLQHSLAQKWKDWEDLDSSRQQRQLLQKESVKQKRHLAIRKFVANAPELIAALKPCWMMSPLSVSEHIDPRAFAFDTVLFDEASQVRTEDAVPAIMRASQVIVVGDNKQLPPTSFFAAAGGEDLEDDDTGEGAYESVLDECWTFMTMRTLKWHYRSQDESLIAFSNRHFYDSRLVTFPNPASTEDKGIRFLHVKDGVYDFGGRRDNIREAEEVVKLVLEHVQSTPERSLGIIGFSAVQTEAIREQLDKLGSENPQLEEFCQEPSPHFFLKPLELVQGDERDVIVLSVGYAADKNGVLRYNFGPLNRQGGERRLNVAITRAKRKLVLVSSMRASDLDLGRTSSRAVALLKDYLAYAESGGRQLEGNRYEGKLRFDSPFEEDVYLSLRDRGFTVRSQIGCSTYRIDLGVVDDERPGEFLLGVECDGATYHSSPTARDRDRLRQQVLEGLGWKFHRIWSREWFKDKPAQIEKLVKHIEQLRAQRAKAVEETYAV